MQMQVVKCEHLLTRNFASNAKEHEDVMCEQGFTCTTSRSANHIRSKYEKSLMIVSSSGNCVVMSSERLLREKGL